MPHLSLHTTPTHYPTHYPTQPHPTRSYDRLGAVAVFQLCAGVSCLSTGLSVFMWVLEPHTPPHPPGDNTAAANNAHTATAKAAYNALGGGGDDDSPLSPLTPPHIGFTHPGGAFLWINEKRKASAVVGAEAEAGMGLEGVVARPGPRRTNKGFTLLEEG
jgi:hypothetical protein